MNKTLSLFIIFLKAGLEKNILLYEGFAILQTQIRIKKHTVHYQTITNNISKYTFVDHYTNSQ